MSESTTQRPLRILHLAASERWTGAAEPLTSVAAEQRAMGHEVWIGCSPGYTFEEKVRERQIPLAEGLHLDRRIHPFHTLSDLRFLPRFCEDNEVDIAHCHLVHDHWLAAHSLKKLKRKNRNRPFIVRTNHGSLPPRSDFLHRWLHTKATDMTMCVSRSIAMATEQALRMSEGSVPWTGGGVDIERFNPELDDKIICDNMGIPHDAPMVGMVARLRAGRGLRWLLRSVPAVLAEVPETYFVIFGRGELYQWFRTEIEKPKYRGQVRWGTYLREGLPLGYAAMDTSVFLGLGSEGSCRAVLEAMACGRPTVGTDRGAVHEIIEDGVTGRVVRDRSEEDLAEALIEIVSDREKARTMGQAARERCEAHFTERKRAERVMEAYRTLLF